MNGAPYVTPTQAPPDPYRRSMLRLVLTLGVVGVAVVGLLVWILKTPGTKTRVAHAEKAVGTPWKAEQVYDSAKTQAAAVKAEQAGTDDANKWKRQEEFNAMLLKLLAQRQQHATAKAATPPPRPPKYAQPLFLDNKLDDKPAASSVPEYLLGVGSYLPCQVETAINSDVEGYFVAKVTTNVHDTATGHHLLVPQGSVILGNTQSNKLVFGSERMDTVSLKLRLPSGKDVELKNAPVTDAQGMAGLTGEINRHLMRIYGAVFITGVLKGGTAAMQSAMSQAAGVNQVAVNLGNGASQATQRLAVPLIDTRPTITVAPGQLCQVILLEPLKLSEMWAQGGK